MSLEPGSVQQISKLFHDPPFDQMSKSYPPYTSLETECTKPQVPKWCLEGPSQTLLLGLKSFVTLHEKYLEYDEFPEIWTWNYFKMDLP